MLDQIIAIESLLKTLPQSVFDITETMIDGVYVRSIIIPEGSILTGKVHNFESIAILAYGTLALANGAEAKVITGPTIMIDEPGIKRLGKALTDCLFFTVHKYNGLISEAETYLSSETPEDYLAIVKTATNKNEAIKWLL